jgi:hypothetical protein
MCILSFLWHYKCVLMHLALLLLLNISIFILSPSYVSLWWTKTYTSAWTCLICLDKITEVHFMFVIYCSTQLHPKPSGLNHKHSLFIVSRGSGVQVWLDSASSTWLQSLCGPELHHPRALLGEDLPLGLLLWLVTGFSSSQVTDLRASGPWSPAVTQRLPSGPPWRDFIAW